MAHDININKKTGKAAYFGVEPAWHGLGQVLGKSATAEQAIELAQLDWGVKKVPTFFKIGHNQTICEGKHAVIRTDTNQYLGTVGDSYEPLQNKDAFGFFDALVNDDEAIYHTAGALGDGQRVWVLAKMPDYIRVGKSDDIIEKYVLLYNSHNGSSGVVACVTPIRVVCNNTLTAALTGTQHKISIRHTKNVKDNLAEAHKVLNITNIYSEQMQEIFTQMADTKVNTAKVQTYLESLYPSNEDLNYKTQGDKIKDSILATFEGGGVGQDLITTKGTVFGLYNAVTYYTDHEKEYKGGDSAKLKSIWFGGSSKIRQKAFDVAVEMLN